VKVYLLACDDRIEKKTVILYGFKLRKPCEIEAYVRNGLDKNHQNRYFYFTMERTIL